MCETKSEGQDVLSDVHIFVQPINIKHASDHDQQKPLYKTRFEFRIPQKTCGSSAASKQTDQVIGINVCESTAEHSVMPDEDGDLLLARRSSDKDSELIEDVVTIEHCMGTSLEEVGLQVWQGSLLMCDFILYKMEEFIDSIAMELGGGLGLSSITMAMVAKMVYCTDVGESILSKCQQNVDNNCHLFGSLSPQTLAKGVFVRELDWTQADMNRDASNPFFWRPDDEENLSKVNIIIAADVIYDNNLTDAFFQTLGQIMKCGCKKTAFISLQRRYNFTLSDLDVTCKEYDHFRSHLTTFKTSDQDDVEYSVSQIPIDFPQYFSYNRVKELELWQITSSF